MHVHTINTQAKLLSDGGLNAQDICVLAYYSKQVYLIRTLLRKNKLSQVSGLALLQDLCDLLLDAFRCKCTE